jgi:hypothetical protein
MNFLTVSYDMAALLSYFYRNLVLSFTEWYNCNNALPRRDGTGYEIFSDMSKGARKIEFISEYDFRMWWGKATSVSDTFTLNTHTVPPQWVRGATLQ